MNEKDWCHIAGSLSFTPLSILVYVYVLYKMTVQNII
jgi:hypothetical protein